ncbi:uncharacterized protein TOL2_C22800 [Desulfobacula toluolica Tol2]|uniref:Uncharacterized protein n=1 Tax=Desulfobacula toluolica (strain DSM 7467 / Tol2) TaxID=651182 RepID=K0NGR9_DESTT|nr:uncharacterized protein TOL2_C22800 [Desulfobacula toluolica Tol2]
MKRKPCRHCGYNVSIDDLECPKCKGKTPYEKKSFSISMLLSLFVLFFLLFYLIDNLFLMGSLF